MPKIIQFNPVVGFGSTGRIVEQIGKFVINRGWDSTIVYSGRPKAENSESHLMEVGSEWDVYLHALQTRLFDRHGLASKRATKELVSVLDEIKPDIFHFHNLHGYYINFEVLVEYVNKRKIPVVWTFHDFWPITGHCTYFSDVDCEKWKSQCYDCPKLKYYPKSYFDNSKGNYNIKKAVFSSIQDLTITPVSHWAASLIQQSFLKDAAIKVVYNGIDLNVFRPRPDPGAIKRRYGISDKFVLVGLATTWGKRKGWDDYIELSKRLPEDIKLLMVGVTNAQKKQLPENIMSINKTNNISELVDIYSMSDIVLNLSYQETFGLTTVEGFACGTPGIVYNRTASPELITNGVGYIAEAGNISTVLEKISLIKRNGKAQYTHNCLSHVKEKFDLQDKYQSYLDIYESKVQ